MSAQNTKLLSSLIKEQNRLREKIVLQRPATAIHFIAGCDSAFIGDKILSVFVIFTYPDLQQLEVSWHASKVNLPYIPGFLGFREIPNLLLAWEKLSQKPDLIMVDGHGIAHPRKLGIASHLGVTLDIPTFGVGKKKLVGNFVEPKLTKGSFSSLEYKNEVVGVTLQSKDNIKPIFISPGHLCDLETAREITIKTLRKHKLPEPTRVADKYSKELKSEVTQQK